MEIILDGVASRVRRERETVAWLAWHTAVLSRMDAKKLPRLEQLMPRRPRKAKAPERDAWKDQFAAFSAWAASFRKE